ncbi:MAG: hypothetical protein JST53_10080 [Actinobacteria bacterium]|nr:hypothetical protein [Actinomycetota bacterium]
MNNKPKRPIRRILFRCESFVDAAALNAAADLACRERATLDLCGTVRRHSALLSLAMVGGAPVRPDQLEAEAVAEMAEKMRVAVAGLPAELGIRSLLLVGNPRRKMAELLAAGDYDLVL